MLEDFKKDELNRDTAKIYMGGDNDFIEIKPSTDKKYINARSLAFKRNRQTIKKKKLTAEKAQRMLGPLFAKYILVDWRISLRPETLKANFPDIKPKAIKGVDDAVLIPFSVENAATVLTHKDYGEFLDYIIDQSEETANFIDEDKKDDSKN